jgi:hypothetical protein
MALFLFRGRQRDPDAVDASKRITDWTRAALDLPEAATVSVSEIACGEPGGGGVETVVLVMRPGHKTEAVKVKMGLGLVTEDALRTALAEMQHKVAE